MKKFVALILMLSCMNALADDGVVALKKGAAAPFSGYLITQDKADKIADMSVEIAKDQKVLGLMTQDQTFLNQRLSLYKDQSDYLSKQLSESRDSGMWSKVGFFVLGAAAASLVAFGAARAVR